MQKGRFIFGGAISLIAWMMFASFIYCLGFSHFDLGLAFRRFQPPYCQWLEVAWFYLTDDLSERVRFWLVVSAGAPTLAGVLMIFAKLRNPTLQRYLSRRRWPGQDEARPLERGVTDNHGHARMMTDNELRREFPPIR